MRAEGSADQAGLSRNIFATFGRMKRRTKLLLKSAAFAIGTLGLGLWIKKRKRPSAEAQQDVWVRPGQRLTFRAELMPGRSALERTFRVRKVLPNGRVVLDGVGGEHAEAEFESVR